MDWWISTLAIVGLFILRLGVPLAITLAVGYLLRRLDARWQAEAEAQRKLNWAETDPTSSPAALTDPLQEIEALVDEAFKRREEPCWVTKGCPEAARIQCPAYQHPYMLCWMARRRATGQVPAECYQCALFPLKPPAREV